MRRKFGGADWEEFLRLVDRHDTVMDPPAIQPGRHSHPVALCDLPVGHCTHTPLSPSLPSTPQQQQ
jgi:hypothetical protein